jgi:hypothetical protein
MNSPRGWKRRFDEPIPLPRGRQLATLEARPKRHPVRPQFDQPGSYLMVNHALTPGRYHLPCPGGGRPATGSNHHAR